MTSLGFSAPQPAAAQPTASQPTAPKPTASPQPTASPPTAYADAATRSQVVHFKRLGNEAFRAGRYPDAVHHYTQAIRLCQPPSHILHSNRSAALVAAGNLSDALFDAVQCVELNPAWPKGHSRLGVALLMLGRDRDAFEAFTHALRLDPAVELVRNYTVGLLLKYCPPAASLASAMGPRRRTHCRPLNCAACCSLLHRPVVRVCGHSVCLGCSAGPCSQCGDSTAAPDKPSVALTEIVQQVRVYACACVCVRV